MTPSLASVFIINGRLFWGFDNDRNGVIVVAYFVDRNGTVTVAFAMVVIVHLASIVKPRLLMSDEISFILHHDGKFIQNANEALEYIAENVAEAVAEECTQNGIEDMDVDGAKDDDEVKEHDRDVEFSDHFESDPDYVYVSPEDCFEVTHW
ncbi:hypothetical protein JHK87_039631 [Glycine soja]|nr:hypothetical protein JHK87_039631 [Glycine soja]